MNPRGVSGLAALFAAAMLADQPPRLAIEPDGGPSRLSLASPGVAPVAGTGYRLRLESTADFQQWRDEGDWSQLADPTGLITTGVDGHRFYRVRGDLETAGPADGADVFGYSAIFADERRRTGFLTPSAFSQAQTPPPYLPALSFDPQTARYWEAFNSDPAAANEGKTPQDPGYRLYDFRLNDAELAVFQQRGFVVSERLGTRMKSFPTGDPVLRSSFGDLYYRVFSDDLPVFVTADSVLHAWHFSYQRMLEEAEELQLSPALQQVLEAMSLQLRWLPDSVLAGPLADSVRDADYFLTVARALLRGEPGPSRFGQDAEVAATLTAIDGLAYVPAFSIYGQPRPFDFSQFKVRGHYERSAGLRRYFRTVMWLARADLRVLNANAPPDPQSRRELGTAIILADALERSFETAAWRDVDSLVRLFVGRQDSMTVPQLMEVLRLSGLPRWQEMADTRPLDELQQRIRAGGLSAQLYAGEVIFSPLGPESVQLPASFAFLGQRFVPDGWAIAQTTFDRIQWPEDLPGITWERKVLRRYASALDVAYSVLGNRQVGGRIAARMLDSTGVGGFRDGYPYAHNLAAVTATLDRLDAAAWEDSIYTRWLWALRALSDPTTGPEFPEAMRTQAWASRTLNTQLASYTELKHDTILYAKQPYASAILCEYPAGFVEPVPTFWRRMADLATATAAGMANLPVQGEVMVMVEDGSGFPLTVTVDAGQRLAARVEHCRQFARTAEGLADLADKELQQTPFTDEDTAFIRGLMNRQDHEYTGPSYDGWYPLLFYKDYGQLVGNTDTAPCNQEDALVADIFTAPPDVLDPVGGVLHEATGRVDLMLIAVDNGPDRMVYAGPTFSHYEFMVPGPQLQRLSDSEWKARLGSGAGGPARPEWTRDYLVTP